MGLDAYSTAQKGKSGEAVAAKICDSASTWLKGGQPDLVLVFISEHFADEYEDILDDLMRGLNPRHMTGCSGHGTIGTAHEYENQSVVSVLLLRQTTLKITVCHICQNQIDESTGPGFWHLETDVGVEQCRGIILLGDPFTTAIDKLVHELNEAYPETPIIGGLASGPMNHRGTHLFENTKVHQEGALLVFLDGSLRMETVVSQGCKPIGQPFIITRGERNLIHEIAGRPPLQVLNEILTSLPPQERARAQHNIFAGLAINEYLEEFHRGDFLVRNLVSADQQCGALSIGALVRTGQTIQFQMRDAGAAQEDMLELLKKAKKNFQGHPVKAGLLCSCNGRGEGLFGKPHHDPASVADVLGNFPVAGFFCNGEIGPVGNRVFVHGYTCAIGLLLDE